MKEGITVGRAHIKRAPTVDGYQYSIRRGVSVQEVGVVDA